MESVKDFPDKPRPGFLLVILPQDAAPLRKEVKQWGDMFQGIPTQCVVGAMKSQHGIKWRNNLFFLSAPGNTRMLVTNIVTTWL